MANCHKIHFNFKLAPLLGPHFVRFLDKSHNEEAAMDEAEVLSAQHGVPVMVHDLNHSLIGIADVTATATS